MTKVFIPVSVKDELPDKKGYYFCLVDSSPYDDHLFDPGNYIIFPPDVTHWLKEILMPSRYGIASIMIEEGLDENKDFVKGADYILDLFSNLLTPNNNERT